MCDRLRAVAAAPTNHGVRVMGEWELGQANPVVAVTYILT